MTRCGHVYCWPCILHYLALSEKKSWRKCPICYEAVHIGDLRSTIAKPHRNFGSGEMVTLQLMYRDKDSLRVYRAGGEDELARASMPNTDFFPHLCDADETAVHSKLLLAKPSEIISIIERERNELKCQLTSEGLDCPDSIFVQQALQLLEEREVALKMGVDGGGIDQPMAKGPVLNVNATEFVPNTNGNGSQCADSSESDECVGNSLANDVNKLAIDGNDDADDADDVQPIDNQIDSKRFYFYQANDGQHLYLHSINVRILQTMYGSLEHAPKTIVGTILQKEICSMSEELRKRLKYLQHLPISCQFEVVELTFEQSLVSKAVLAKFQEELDHRLAVRRRRARAEQKRDRQIEIVNERQIGKIIRATTDIDVTSDQQFPIVSCYSYIAKQSMLLISIFFSSIIHSMIQILDFQHHQKQLPLPKGHHLQRYDIIITHAFILKALSAAPINY